MAPDLLELYSDFMLYFSTVILSCFSIFVLIVFVGPGGPDMNGTHSERVSHSSAILLELIANESLGLVGGGAVALPLPTVNTAATVFVPSYP